MTEKIPVRELVHQASDLEVEIVPPQSAFPEVEFREVKSKKIFLFLLLFYAIAFSVRFLFLEGPGFLSSLKSMATPGAEIPASPSILFGYFLYMCFACQFFPIPTLPPIAFTAKVFHPVLVSVVGALGTCVANLNDYAILGWLFQHKRVKKVRDLTTYRKLLTFFDKYAFLTLSAASFLPIPIDVIRLLAISRGYSYVKYIAGTFVGRVPRYLLIAYLGKELPTKYILVIFGVSLIPAGVKYFSDIIRKWRRK